MKKEVIEENEDFVLWLYPQDGILHHVVKQSIDGNVFKKLLLTGLKVIEQDRASKWLSDDRKAGMIDPEASAWSQEIFTARSAEAGWKYWAILLPDSGRAKVCSTRLVDEIGPSGIVAQAFDNEAEALEWLRECN